MRLGIRQGVIGHSRDIRGADEGDLALVTGCEDFVHLFNHLYGSFFGEVLYIQMGVSPVTERSSMGDAFKERQGQKKRNIPINQDGRITQ